MTFETIQAARASASPAGRFQAFSFLSVSITANPFGGSPQGDLLNIQNQLIAANVSLSGLQKFSTSDYSNKYSFVNSSNSKMEMHLYMLTARNDHLSNGTTGTNIANWFTYSVAQVNATVASTPTDADWTPYLCPMLCHEFRIKDMGKTLFSEGECVTKEFTQPNRMFDFGKCTYTNYLWYKGWKTLFATFVGSPLYDSAHTAIGLSAATCNMVSTERFRATALSPAAYQYNYNNLMPVAFAPLTAKNFTDVLDQTAIIE